MPRDYSSPMALPDLSGKVAVITGASRGIGAGLAKDFRARGMRLALCARGTTAFADDGDAVLARRFDVADAAAMEDFAAATAKRFGRVDLWINNAGMLEPIAPVRQLAAEELRRHFEVNVFGVLHGSRAYLRRFVEAQKGGVLINVSSGAAWKGYAGWAAYCMGKAAVDRLTETLQLEEASSGLRAYAVAPGIVNTAMQELIRAQSAENFPDVERFRQFERDGAFNSMGFVAQHFLAIAFDPEAQPDTVIVRLPAEIK